jgi:hypothetical protein
MHAKICCKLLHSHHTAQIVLAFCQLNLSLAALLRILAHSSTSRTTPWPFGASWDPLAAYPLSHQIAWRLELNFTKKSNFYVVLEPLGASGEISKLQTRRAAALELRRSQGGLLFGWCHFSRGGSCVGHANPGGSRLEENAAEATEDSGTWGIAALSLPHHPPLPPSASSRRFRMSRPAEAV